MRRSNPIHKIGYPILTAAAFAGGYMLNNNDGYTIRGGQINHKDAYATSIQIVDGQITTGSLEEQLYSIIKTEPERLLLASESIRRTIVKE